MPCVCGHPKKDHFLGIGKCADCECEYYEDVAEALADSLADSDDTSWLDPCDLDNLEGEVNG